MNKFSNTALGKITQTTLWLLGSYLFAYAVTVVGSHKFAGVWVTLPGIVNILAYGFSTLRDQTVPNLPSSQLLTLVPAAVAAAVAPTLPQPGDVVVPAQVLPLAAPVLVKPPVVDPAIGSTVN